MEKGRILDGLFFFLLPTRQYLDGIDLYCFDSKVVLKAIFGLVLFTAVLKLCPASALKSLQLYRLGRGIKKFVDKGFIVIFQTHLIDQ